MYFDNIFRFEFIATTELLTEVITTIFIHPTLKLKYKTLISLVDF